MKALLISSLILLSSCTASQQGHHHTGQLSTTGIEQELLEHPCQARAVGKSLSDIAKNSKHNSYCVILYKNQLEKIKESQLQGVDSHAR